MQKTEIPQSASRKLIKLAQALIDQEQAVILVPPQRRASGFWFGGGNMIIDRDGNFIISGRYRNYGDSRTGLKAGERGLECALFASASFAEPFTKIKSFTKADLTTNEHTVKSIEGTALHQTANGVELYISTEKAAAYPEEVREYQKPGTGVWSIDLISAAAIEQLSPANISNVIPPGPPEGLHVKDPVVIDSDNTQTRLMYCVHPFSWTCSYTAMAVREDGKPFVTVNKDVLPRGTVWDVAAARITTRLRVPRLGIFRDLPPLSLYFYDSCECVRQLDENPAAVKRPRGYSCEEIGGLAWSFDDDLTSMTRLSVIAPLFVSPCGTGCSRYVDTLRTDDAIYATWQQSRADLSQPLVGHQLPMERIEELLA